MVKTCLNRLIGRCKKLCKQDYDISHHPNNYDCKDYQEVNLITFEVISGSSKKYSFQRKLLKKDSSLNELLNKLM